MSAKNIPAEVLAILKASDVTGNALKLPTISNRALYLKVAKCIEAAGGWWDRGSGLHQFNADPKLLFGEAWETGKLDVAQAAKINHESRQKQLAKLQPALADSKNRRNRIKAGQLKGDQLEEGMELMRLLKHIPNFFPTPQAVIEAMLEEVNPGPGSLVLEPSAGKGDIADAVKATGATVICVELNSMLAEHLSKKGYHTINKDFLEINHETISAGQAVEFDFVIMNPPFERGADKIHILKAFDFLKAGGRLVSVASSTTGEKLKSWAATWGGEILELPKKAFVTSERPTGVNTCLITAGYYE